MLDYNFHALVGVPVSAWPAHWQEFFGAGTEKVEQWR